MWPPEKAFGFPIRKGNLSRKCLPDVLLSCGTPWYRPAVVCKCTSNLSENRKILQPQKKGGKDPERQFSVLTFPKTTTTQLKAIFAWTALKIPQWWRFHKLSRPSVPEFHSSYFGGSVWITFLIPDASWLISTKDKEDFLPSIAWICTIISKW